VRKAFRRLQEQLPAALAAFDRGVDQVVTSYLEAIAAPFTRLESRDRITFDVGASARLPEVLAEGGRFAIGNVKQLEGYDPIHLSHPLLEAAVAEARGAGPQCPVVQVTVPAHASGALQSRRGRRGRLIVVKAAYDGLEPVERLIPVALFEGDATALLPDQAGALLGFAIDDRPMLTPPLALDAQVVADVLEEALFLDQAAIEEGEQERFDRAVGQLERYAEDRLRVLRRRLAGCARRLDSVRTRRDAAHGLDARDALHTEIGRLEDEQQELDRKIAQLEARDDERYQRLRADLQKRRYTPVRTETIIEAEFVLS
jgi:hypothetical protein